MRRGPLTLLAALALVTGPHVASADVQYVQTKPVYVTWYLPTGQRMANGEFPHLGAAACSTDMRLGTVVLLPDRVVICKDRGLLGSTGYVDIFVPDKAHGDEVRRMYATDQRHDASLFIPEE
jgi:hypothetical protein